MSTARCEEVMDALAEGAELAPALRAHAAACPLCGRLVAGTDALVADGAPLLTPGRELAEKLAGGVARVRPFRALERAGPLLGILAALVCWGLWKAARVDVEDHGSVFGAALLALLLSWLLGVAAVLARGVQGTGLPPERQWALLASSALLVVAVLVLMSNADAEVLGAQWRTQTLKCVGVSLLYAAVMAAAVVWAAAGTALRAPSLVAAGVGCIGGVTGTLMLHLGCSMDEPWHLGLAHGGAAAAAVVAARLLTRRSVAP